MLIFGLTSLFARSVGAGLTAFFVSLLLGPLSIRLLQKKLIGQVIRDVGPQAHFSKKGTPTMGGVLIIGSVILASLLWGNLNDITLWMALFVTTSCALIGWYDDYRKLILKHHGGLPGRYKLALQSVVAVTASTILYLHNPDSAHILIPFGHTLIQMGVFVIVLNYFVIVGSSNAVNLTDGLDGLAAMPVAFVATVFLVIAAVSSHIDFAMPLNLPFLPEASEMMVFSAALIGALLGFLWFNAYPAQVFMGDVGALALGGALGVIAINLREPFTLVIAGGIFVIEALSVMLQVGYFKFTKGKRILKMSPIHHHFELSGWPEPKVTLRFWIITLGLCLIALAGVLSA